MSDIATTEELLIEYVKCVSFDQLLKEVEDFNDRPAFRAIPGPLLRARIMKDEWGYSVYGDVMALHHNEESNSTTTSVEREVRFGYFETDRGELKGFRTITTEWAKEYFLEFGKHLLKLKEVVNQPPKQKPKRQRARQAQVYRKTALIRRAIEDNSIELSKACRYYGISTTCYNDYIMAEGFAVHNQWAKGLSEIDFKNELHLLHDLALKRKQQPM